MMRSGAHAPHMIVGNASGDLGPQTFAWGVRLGTYVPNHGLVMVFGDLGPRITHPTTGSNGSCCAPMQGQFMARQAKHLAAHMS